MYFKKKLFLLLYLMYNNYINCNINNSDNNIQKNIQQEKEYRKNKFEEYIGKNYGTILLKNIITDKNKQEEIIVYILYKRDKDNNMRYIILKASNNYENILSIKYKDYKDMKVLSKYNPKIIFSTELSSMNPMVWKRKFSTKYIIRLDDEMMTKIIITFIEPDLFKIFIDIINNQYMDEIYG